MYTNSNCTEVRITAPVYQSLGRLSEQHSFYNVHRSILQLNVNTIYLVL